MRFSRAFHRPWVYVIVPARVIAGWFTIVSLQSLAVLPVETRAERRGEFVIAYHTYDALDTGERAGPSTTWMAVAGD